MEHINIFPNTLFVNIFYIKIKDNYYTKLISFFSFLSRLLQEQIVCCTIYKYNKFYHCKKLYLEEILFMEEKEKFFLLIQSSQNITRIKKIHKIHKSCIKFIYLLLVLTRSY